MVEGAVDPLYLKVARTLIAKIGDGEYAVGDLLPPETELAQALGVSRQTVRQALAELREMGLISARRGVGTRVENDRPGRRFNYSSRSVEDLLNFASNTRLWLMFRQRFVAGPTQSNRFGIPPAQRWMHLGCLRRTLDDDQPFCWTDIYLDARYSDLTGDGSNIPTPIFSRIEEREKKLLAEIHQEIRGVVLGPAVAARLGTEDGAPGLEISRLYFLPDRQLVEVSVNTIPSYRYHFALELDLTR